MHRVVQALRNPAADALRCLGVRERAPVHANPLQRVENLAHEQLLVLAGYAQPLYEILPVEADENSAHIENNVFDHQTIFTFPLVTRNTITRDTMVVSVSMVASAAAVPSDMRVTS